MHTRRSFLNPCLAGLLVFAAAPAAQALASPAPTVTTGGLYRVLIKVSKRRLRLRLQHPRAGPVRVLLLGSA